MSHKEFLALVKKHKGWIDGEHVRFPSVYNREQFEKEYPGSHG